MATRTVAAVCGAAAMASMVVLMLHHRHSRRSLSNGKRLAKKPCVHLVGAGPGDPELLTLAAVRALRECDMIVADVLVPEAVYTSYIGKDVRVRVANKVKGQAHEAQEELQLWTLEGLQKGLDVVRLKGGDPFLYGRGGEEVNYFIKHGFNVEVVPGLSSSMVGPMSMGVPVTTRGFADQFAVATLHGRRGETPGVPSPYRPNRTVVFLMSVSRLHKLVEQLLAAGYPPSLPVSCVEKATTEQQRSMHTTIRQFLEDAAKFKLESPAVIIVGGTAGNAAGLPGQITWARGGVTYHAQATERTHT
jgi:uroporphyrin-III C-methyltransferase